MKKKILIVVAILLVIIVGIGIYDYSTINNEYYISEKNLYIPIFVYHDIVKNESEVKYDYMQTTVDTFEKQINGLLNVGYHFITYDDLIEYKNGEKKLHKKSCLLTFDDGFSGVYDNAFAIFKKYNIPATLFIINENMGTLSVITWKQAEEMQNSGLVTIASHSIEHPEFTSLSVEEAETNVRKSYEEIEKKLGEKKNKIFTYPYGLYKAEQIEKIKENGIVQNLTDNKINKSNELDLYRLHRCYPLSDSIFKILAKICYRSIKY